MTQDILGVLWESQYILGEVAGMHTENGVGGGGGGGGEQAVSFQIVGGL